MSGQKLYKADLRGTNFANADLSGASLFGAFAKDASFKCAAAANPSACMQPSFTYYSLIHLPVPSCVAPCVNENVARNTPCESAAGAVLLLACRHLKMYRSLKYFANTQAVQCQLFRAFAEDASLSCAAAWHSSSALCQCKSSARPCTYHAHPASRTVDILKHISGVPLHEVALSCRAVHCRGKLRGADLESVECPAPPR